MAISSSAVAGSGSTTVLNRRRRALDSSLMPRSRSFAVAIRLKPCTAATSASSSGTGSTFSERMVTSASCTSEGMRVSSSTRTRRPVAHRPVHRARHERRLGRALGQQAGVVPAVAQGLLGRPGGALHEQRRIAADRRREVLADPGLGRAGHAEQQQGAVGGQGGDGDLHQPPLADVLRGDHRAVGQHAAEQVGDDRPRRQLPVRRPRPVVAAASAASSAACACSACGRRIARRCRPSGPVVVSSSSMWDASRRARRASGTARRARTGGRGRPERDGQREQRVGAHRATKLTSTARWVRSYAPVRSAADARGARRRRARRRAAPAGRAARRGRAAGRRARRGPALDARTRSGCSSSSHPATAPPMRSTRARRVASVRWRRSSPTRTSGGRRQPRRSTTASHSSSSTGHGEDAATPATGGGGGQQRPVVGLRRREHRRRRQRAQPARRAATHPPTAVSIRIDGGRRDGVGDDVGQRARRRRRAARGGRCRAGRP